MGQITGKSFGVAADVNHAFGFHGSHCINAGGGAALPRGVQEYNIGVRQARVGLCRSAHPIGCIGSDEPRVVDLIGCGVGAGIAHRVRVALHANDLLCPARRAQADGANAAVGIDHCFLAGQGSELNGLGVQHFGLFRVDLVKAAGRNGELQPAQRIGNFAGAIQGTHIAAQLRAGAAGFAVLHHAGHPGGLFPQGFHKIAAAGQVFLRGHQHHQHLTAGFTAAHQHMAQQTGAAIPFKSRPAAGAGGFQRSGNGLVNDGILQQAVRIRQHAVGARCINAACQSSTRPGGKGGDGLVTVLPRFCLPQHGGYRGKPPQQALFQLLLVLELVGVGLVQQRAAAAFQFIIGAGYRHGV